jgi:hypothetical protein
VGLHDLRQIDHEMSAIAFQRLSDLAGEYALSV